jgi:hypothetical protein
VLAACRDPVDTAWVVRFSPPELAERAARIEARVLGGGCSGPVRFATELGSDRAGAMPPVLERGLYGVAAEASDGSCVRFAAGCAEVELPLERGRPVETVLTATGAGSRCPATDCAEGRCPGDGADGGVPPGPPPLACSAIFPDAGVETGCCPPGTELRNPGYCRTAEQPPAPPDEASAICLAAGACPGTPPAGRCGVYLEGPEGAYGCYLASGDRRWGGSTLPCGGSDPTAKTGAELCPDCEVSETPACAQPYYCRTRPLWPKSETCASDDDCGRDQACDSMEGRCIEVTGALCCRDDQCPSGLCDRQGINTVGHCVD